MAPWLRPFFFGDLNDKFSNFGKARVQFVILFFDHTLSSIDFWLSDVILWFLFNYSHTFIISYIYLHYCGAEKVYVIWQNMFKLY